MTSSNFSRVKEAVDDNYRKITALEDKNRQLKERLDELQRTVQQLQSQIAQKQNRVTGTCPSNQAIKQINEDGSVVCETSLDARITAIETSNVMAMNPYVVVMPDPYVDGGTTIRFTGVNVQIVNGTGWTDQINGLGNLIIGYNNPRTIGRETCSLGQYWDNQTNCQNNHGTWDLNFKTGSHNLIVGDQNAYSSYGGIVAGRYNVINGPFATVTGGTDNIGAGRWSSVSGGWDNTAEGDSSSVSGGKSNTASGPYSSVSGGWDNTAEGDSSSVSGGRDNIAEGDSSSVSGGRDNIAKGEHSSVSGGSGNTAYGSSSSVSGGTENTANGSSSSVSGGTRNIADGNYSSVSGGQDNTAEGNYSTVSGGTDCTVEAGEIWGARANGGDFGDCP